jgi:hypothetical protein
MKISGRLQAAITAELAANPVSGDEATFLACERIFAASGEASFDMLNPSDMLIRSFVLAEAYEAAHPNGQV